MKNFFYSALFLLASLNPLTADESTEYACLDRLAVEANTDKSSLFHNYTKIYAKHFAKLKNEPIKFLEIGINKGCSVKMWDLYFPKGDLYFIDINPQSIEYYSPTSKYFFLDQADLNQLHTFAQNVGKDFDIIIDDGGHRMEQQFNSFVSLFPLLKSGGLYIIEDLCTSYWTSYGGNGTQEEPKAGEGTMVQTLQTLVDYINFPSARTGCADIEKMPPVLRAELNYFQENILSIQFYGSLCIIEKR
ncbi:hypothetical protein PHSC3_000840 [Chlamydiales bacterium STE3]|nr:hypothetical protein PHSC3_000840 [Chlamydiales bacterium STE3]